MTAKCQRPSEAVGRPETGGTAFACRTAGDVWIPWRFRRVAQRTAVPPAATVLLGCAIAGWSCLAGCGFIGGSGGSTAARRPVSQESFGQGAPLLLKLHSRIESFPNVAGNQHRVFSNDVIDVELTGKGKQLVTRLRRMEVHMSIDGNETVRLQVAPNRINGSVRNKTLAEAVGADDDELTRLGKQMCEQPYFRFELDHHGEPVNVVRDAPPEADVIVSPGFLDYTLWFVAPAVVEQPSWTRSAHYPLEAGVRATGKLTYTIDATAWQARDRHWFLPVTVAGTMTADGSHTASISENLAAARAGNSKQQTVRYRDSNYQINGSLLYSRITGQFAKGKIKVVARHTVDNPGGSVKMRGTQTIELTQVEAGRELPLPRSTRTWTAAATTGKPMAEQRALIQDARRAGNGWLVPVDLKFPPGVVHAVRSADGVFAYVLDSNGTLRHIDLERLVELHRLELGETSLGLAQSAAGLVVLQRSSLVVLNPATLRPIHAWQSEPADTIAAAPTLDWVVLGNAQQQHVTVVNAATGRVEYDFRAQDLSRVSPSGGRPRTAGVPERLARGGFTADGSQFVLLGSAIHLFQRQGDQLFYRRDSRPLDAAADCLVFSTGQRLAVHGKGGAGNGALGRASYHVLSLTDLNRIEASFPMSSRRLQAFTAFDKLLFTHPAGGIEQTIGSAASRMVLSVGQALPTGDIGAIVPTADVDAHLALGTQGSCWVSLNPQPPALLGQPHKLDPQPANIKVENYTRLGKPSELSDGPVVALPDRLHKPYPTHGYSLAWSPDGEAFYSLQKDGSILRGSTSLRRLVRRAIPNEEYDFLAVSAAGVVASNAKTGIVLDPQTLAARRKLTPVVGTVYQAAPASPWILNVDPTAGCFLWWNLETGMLQRVFARNIAGLDTENQRALDRACRGIRTSQRRHRIRHLELSPDGRRALITLDKELLVVATQPAWKLHARWPIPDGYSVRYRAGPSHVALLPLERGARVGVMDWREPGREIVSLDESISRSKPVWFSPSRKRYYVIDQKQVRVLGEDGRNLHVGEAYTGRVSNSLQALRIPPDPTQPLLVYFATENSLGWYRPPR